MKVFIYICLAIMGIIFLCLLYRLMIHYQLNRIDVKKASSLFQTKLNHYKQRELQKSFTFLVVGIMGLITVLSFAIIQLFQFDTQLHGVKTTNQLLRKEIKTVKAKKSMKNLLKDYPLSGLGLQRSLDGFIEESTKTVDLKEKVEQSLSKQLLPYLTDANVMLSTGDDSDSLHVVVTGSIEATNANLVILGQTITALMKEIEDIEKITEVTITIVDREGNDLYKGTYVRNEKGEFTFQSELRKGKG
ncbi:hypothetical protein IGI39_004421 [Enterococcus sp. AZ135]|uniref:hypothetical protein n=1 Tax=unclassified Enterococcus TaxID=2608891 RepID=UPI003F1ED2C4